MKNKKKWGLEINAQKGFIKDRIEFDYLAKLNEHEAEFLNAFNLAIANGDFKALFQLGYKISAKLKKEMNRERYLAELCSHADNYELKKQLSRKAQTLKFKRTLAESMLSDLEGEDFNTAMAEVVSVIGLKNK